MFRLEPEGHNCWTKSMVIAPFWLSTEHHWTALTPFWLSADDMSICQKQQVYIWRVCSQKPISPFLSIFKYGHHRIIQKIIFKMIPRSLHIKNYFWSYDQKYQKFSYYFLYISAASIANISIWQKWTYRFLRTNSSYYS